MGGKKQYDKKAAVKRQPKSVAQFCRSVKDMADIKIAKKYLEPDELKVLNNLVSGYFDFAEIQAICLKNSYTFNINLQYLSCEYR